MQKKENAALVKDFYPISLATLTYKVVAKVLVERLKQVMDAIISPFQSAFIEGRQILDPLQSYQESTTIASLLLHLLLPTLIVQNLPPPSIHLV